MALPICSRYFLAILVFLISFDAFGQGTADTAFYLQDSSCHAMPGKQAFFNSDYNLIAPAFLELDLERSTNYHLESPRPAKNNNFEFWLLVFLATLATTTFRLFGQDWLDSYRASISNKSAFQVLEQRTSEKWPFHLINFTILFSTLGIWIQQELWPEKNTGLLDGDWSFLKIAIILSAIYLIKVLSLQILSFLIKKSLFIDLSILQLNRSAYLFSIIALPLCFVHLFGNENLRLISIWIAVISILILYMNWLIRSLQQVLSHLGAYFLHILLYLCGLEILPLLLWGKNVIEVLKLKA